MTAQRSDIIYITGEQYALFSNPLDHYWTKRNPKPTTGWPSTACWRSYIATWEIAEDTLYLIDLEFFAPDGTEGIDYVFPGYSNKNRIKATWYSGELRIPMGDCLEYEHMGYESTFESDWFISIEKGNVVSQRYKANY